MRGSVLLDTLLKIPDRGVIITDSSGNIENVNPFFEKICGYNNSDLKGKKPGALLQGPKTESKAKKIMREAIFNAKPCDVKLHNYTKNGEQYLTHLKITPFKDENGYQKFVGVHDILKDRKKNNRKLAVKATPLKNNLSEEQIQQLQNIQKASYETNIVAITNADGIINYVNDLFCKVSGYSRDELRGETHKILNSGYHPNSFYEQMWQSIRSGKIWEGILKNKKKSGSYYWAQTIIHPFKDSNGNVNQFISISQDISTLVNAKELLNKQNEMLKDYAFINSHHIRGPLSNILGIVEHLKRDKFLKERDFVYDLESTAGELDVILKLLNNIIEGNQAKLNQFKDSDEKLKDVNDIWLIDDDRIQLKLNERLLKNFRKGIQISKFLESKNALHEILKNNAHPDLILLDLNMPDTNGFEFMDILKRSNKTINIVLLTSSIDLRDMNQASNYSFVNSFINKPLTEEKLKKIFQ